MSDSDRGVPGSGQNTFRQVREQLRYWPYTIHQIEDTLDIGLIEGRGRQLLFQAINSRNLTAFVGSGLSAAYGRLSWNDWQTEQFSVVRRSADAFRDLIDKAEVLIEAHIPVVNPDRKSSTPATYHAAREAAFAKNSLQQPGCYNIWRWLRFRKVQIDNARRQIQRLSDTFHRSDANVGSFPGGEALPMKFQIAQQLHNRLRGNIQLFLPPTDRIEPVDETIKLCWPGARIDGESAAPVEALKTLRKILDANPIPEITSLEAGFNAALTAYVETFTRPQASASAEDLAKMLLVDERAHAMITLASALVRPGVRRTPGDAELRRLSALEKALNIYDLDVLKRDIDGIRQKPDQYRVLGAFKFSSLKMLEERIETQDATRHRLWSGMLTSVRARLDVYFKKVNAAGDKRTFLTPTSRFLVATYLNLLDDPWEVIGLDDKEAKLSDDSDLLKPLKRDDFRSRRSIIANRFDPLAKTVRQLGITRYITMNYDLEIERFFQDIGYRDFPKKIVNAPVKSGSPEHHAWEFRTDPTGGVLIDQTFDRHHASELTAFALDDSRKDAAVFHLHGRATRDDRLVITERDYMNLYLWEDSYRDTVNEGITMAFSSSPLIFLGLGMSEADLLRPLRQFMSNRDRTIGYHAVAILPAEKPIEARTKFSVTCFLRYGVHTIFYGSGVMELEQDGKTKDLGIDWLCRIMQLTYALSTEVKNLSNGGATEAPLTVLARLAKAVDFVSDDIEGYPKGAVALMALFGKVVQVDQSDPDAFTSAMEPFIQSIRSKSLTLKLCKFTPVRPSHDAKFSRHYDKAVFIDGDDYVGFATLVLNEALLILLDLHEMGATRERNVADFAALSATLNGLIGAFLTGALNAQLLGLEKEWRSWWKNWQQSPPHRKPAFQRLNGPIGNSKAFQTARYVRHRVDSIITDIADQENALCDEHPIESVDGKTSLKLAYQTRVRAFDTLLMAIHDTFSDKPPDPMRRLLITVAAYRGLGKGSFLTAFSCRLGLSTYERVTWPQRPEEASQPFLAAAAFINLSFSTEIASCFDSLLDALLDVNTALKVALGDLEHVSADVVRQRLECSLNPGAEGEGQPYRAGKNGPRAANDVRKAYEQALLGTSRMKSIGMMFDEFGVLSGTIAKRSREFGRPRFLLYVSGLGLIYDDRKRPKNGEIELLLKMLFGEEGDKCPMDVILVGSEFRIGSPFSDSYGEGGRAFAQIPLTRKHLQPRAQEQIAMRVREGQINVDSTAPEDAKFVNHVHFARPVSAASLLADNFPILATALYLRNPPAQSEPDRDEATRAQATRETEQLNRVKSLFDAAVEDGRNASDEEMRRLWMEPKLPDALALDAARRAVWREVERRCAKPLLHHGHMAMEDVPDGTDMRALLRLRLKWDGLDVRNEWRLVRRYIGYNRFTVTILLAAAEQIVIQSHSPAEGAADAEEFIRTTVDQLRNVGTERREELVLQAVLDRYRQFHVVGHADLDMEFHQLILRHLGIIGSPTSSAVMVRLPEFRKYFERVGRELDTSRRRFLARALTVLAYRGLVFRIDPNPRLVSLAKSQKKEDDPYWPADQDFRYALHRTVQRYAISKLGVGNIDPVLTNSFAPRLYASMPSIGTGLSVASYTFLRTLLIGLSQYPDVPGEDSTLNPWLFTTKITNIRVQALRAALSLARTTLSVATLSRFPTKMDAGSQRLGLLENYKIRLRWIIRMAWELVEVEEGKEVEKDPKADFPHLNPLYRDEIVWLYNELGVVALTQGNLTEALGFLRQAAEHNEDIEGRSRYGPIHDHIDLNHAVVQFERGRLTSAVGRLERLKDKYPKGTLLHHVSEAKLCVVDHIRGRFEGLADRYDAAVVALQDLGDERSSALFLSHRARFLAAIDQPNASSQLQLARGLAETGGHEDVRHHIDISRITVETRQRAKQSETGTSTPSLEQLRDIEVYGQRMGIWSLQVDALKLRAEILLGEGETSTAGALLVRSMAIAKRNRMMLRLNAALTLYARLLLSRKDKKGAERHALLSLDLAKSIGYSPQTSSAQHILSKINPSVY